MSTNNELAAAIRRANNLAAIAAPIIADALIIADSAARSDIEIHCLAIFDHTTQRRDRYDTRDFGDPGLHEEDRADLRETIDRALRYLTARRLIDRDPHAPHLVRFLRTPKEPAA